MDNILELPGVTILAREDTEHDIRFTVEVEYKRVICTHCGSVENANRFGKKPQMAMDMPIRAKRVGLDIQRKRYRCKDCNRTFMQPLPFIDEKRAATQRLIRFIEEQSLRRTFTGIGYEVGVTESTVRAIFKDHIKKLERTIHFETPEWLGLDELKLMKRMRGMVTNVKARTVIELLPNRDMPTVQGYLRSIKDKQKIQVVTMDMWGAYKHCVRQLLPDAQIVVDKFHVIKPVNLAMDKVRKEVRRGLTDRQRRTLMHDRFILLHRESDLKEKDILIRGTWFGAFPQLEKAYELKEQFFGIYEGKDRQEAMERFDAWKASVPDDLEWAFHDVLTYMSNWREEIFAYFAYGRATNAYTEAVNGLAKLIARNGRGYSFEAVRAKVLYGNGLKVTARPKYDKTMTTHSFYIGPGVEVQHYTSLGNEISTLSRELEGGTL